MNTGKYNSKVENFLNRGKAVEKRAFNVEVPMEHNLMYFIMFANLGGVILLGFLYAMLSVNQVLTVAIAGIVFSSPLAFFMTSALAVTFGTCILMLITKIAQRRAKAKDMNVIFDDVSYTPNTQQWLDEHPDIESMHRGKDGEAIGI
jgi:hypothetical protein